MNAKSKGSRNERRFRVILEAAGYRVIRSGGSRGVFDLVGSGRGPVVLVQVKTNRGPSPAEVAAIEDFPTPPNARKVIHRWQDGQREPEVRAIA